MTGKTMTTMRDNAALRWLVLLLISGLMFSTYYFQDFYSGLRDLMETDFGFTSEQFGRILGLTVIANLAGMIIVGGIIIDKWGIRLAGLVFGGVAALGGLISALTASELIFQNNTLFGLILGRIFFGVGLEVCCVLCMRTIVKWFKGYEVALAMGINMAFGRLGSALAIAISLDIAGGTVSPAVTFAAALIGISLIMFLIYTFFDYRLESQEKKVATLKAEQDPKTAAEAKAEESEDFKFSDLIKLLKNSSFIYITLLCVAFYSAVFPFIQYAPDILVNKFGFNYNLPADGSASVIILGSEVLGNAMVYIIVFIFALCFTLIPNNISKGKGITRLVIFVLFIIVVYANRDFIGVWLQNGPKTTALIPLGTIIFTPIFGSMVDKKGKAASIMMLGAFLLIFAHLSLALGNHPIFAYSGLLSLGIAFSLLPAAMWPSVAKIVAESRLGTAYATMFTIQNYGLGAFFWGIGALLIIIPVNRTVHSELEDVRQTLIVSEKLTVEEVAVNYELYADAIREKMQERIEIGDVTEGVTYEAEKFLVDTERFLSKEKFLTSGQVAEVVKLKQANGMLPFYDYRIPIFVLVICGVVSIFLAYKLKKADKRQGYGLELPSGSNDKKEE